MLPTVVVSALLLCTVAGQGCLTLVGIKDMQHLINNLQKDPSSTCSCSGNVTNCSCLPIPSDNCTTPCFQEGLSQMTNTTVKTKFPLIFYRVKNTVERLRSNKCLERTVVFSKGDMASNINRLKAEGNRDGNPPVLCLNQTLERFAKMCQCRSELDGDRSVDPPRWQLSDSSREVRNRVLTIEKEGTLRSVGSGDIAVSSNL
ncbi:PREDICTED: interleukin-9 [Hipposideros armiger]|uniref:Interleukin-9 n=1 Tax=Hipposideros armiger TaxID=186990 RepID=A0A8B7RC02_HIPAR|nr:PREDICTED: interleukin-9 [Hipposideros armiger]